MCMGLRDRKTNLRVDYVAYWDNYCPETITITDTGDTESMVLDHTGEPYVKKKTYNPGFKIKRSNS